MPQPPNVRRGVFTNWARNQRAAVAAYHRPASEADVVRLVREAAARGQKVKLVGAGHSWSDIACPDEVLVSLDALDRVVAVDEAQARVTVEAGLRLAHLNEQLAAHGLALPIVGSIAEQSIAGATSTGTHGSGPRIGCLSTLVVALRLVTAAGEVLDVSAQSHPELFQAARLGLGALGIVVQLTLQCAPAFRLEEITEPLPFDDALARLPQLVAEEEFVKLWWLPHTDVVQVFRYRRTGAALSYSPLRRWVDDRLVNRFVFAFVLWLGALVPRWIPTLNRLVRRVYFQRRRSVGRSDLMLTIPMPPRHQEVEYAIPVERTAEALRWMRETMARERRHVDFVVETRFVAADELWMSPAYGRASSYIGAYAAGTSSRERYFALFEEQMRALGGRPHWGKQFSATADQLRDALPCFERFRVLRAQLDPQGMFDNAFLRRVFGASKQTSARSTSAA